ncbi:hypothetical protein [Infirmifilum sp.]|uniref:hypothetical protein n=1 Tax=Infirmifilum sp. TaxID=2856575 RepID=UPI003D11427D
MSASVMARTLHKVASDFNTILDSRAARYSERTPAMYLVFRKKRSILLVSLFEALYARGGFAVRYSSPERSE